MEASKKPFLSDDQKKIYRENGFLVVENILSQELCEQIVGVYERYAEDDYRGIMNLERGYIEYKDVLLGREVETHIEVDDKDAKFIWNIIKFPSVVRCLEELQEAEVMYLQSMFLFKKVQTRYANQAWNPHQDNAYPMARYGWYITGNFILEDQDPDNGGMNIYPGSHVEPILPNIKVKSFHEQEGGNPGHMVKVPKKYKKIDLLMKKRSILFLHGNNIHGSYANQSKTRSRPMFSIPYGTKGITLDPNFLVGGTGKRKEKSLYLEWEEAFLADKEVYLCEKQFKS